MKYSFWLAACCIALPASQVIAESGNLTTGEYYQPTASFSDWSRASSSAPSSQAPYPSSSGRWEKRFGYRPGQRYGTAPGVGYSASNPNALPKHYNFRPTSPTGWQGAAPFSHYGQPALSAPKGWNPPPADQWYDNRSFGNYPDAGYGYGADRGYETPYGTTQRYGAPYGFGSGQGYNSPYPPHSYQRTPDYDYPSPPPYGEQIPASGYGPDPGYGYGYPVDYGHPYHGFVPGAHGSYRDFPGLPLYPTEQLESEYGLPWTAIAPPPAVEAQGTAPANSDTPPANYEDLSRKYGIPPTPGREPSGPFPSAAVEKSAVPPAVSAPEQEKPAPQQAPAPAPEDASSPPPAAAVMPAERTEGEAASVSPPQDGITTTPAKPEEQEPSLQISPPETVPASPPATFPPIEGSPGPGQLPPPEINEPIPAS